MAVSELSDVELVNRLDLARDRYTVWMDRSSWASMSLIVSVFFIPTLGPKPFAIAVIGVAFCLFRFSVWERERYRAAQELFSRPRPHRQALKEQD